MTSEEKTMAIGRRITMTSGYSIPMIGLGTYQLNGNQVTSIVGQAVQLGYRHFDTATFYRNEKQLGEALKKVKIDRSELFVTTKMWYSDHGFDSALKAFQESYDKLGLDYIDLYLVHWPGTNDDKQETNKRLRKETWKAFEQLVESGKVRSIGVSNYTVAHLTELFEYCKIKPAVNQVEFHPKLYQQDLLKFCQDNDIVLEAYSSLAKGKLLNNKLVTQLASKYGKSSSQILLRWGLQHGLVIIPKSSDPVRLAENINLDDFEISDADMCELDSLNQNWHCTWDPSTVP